MDGQPPDGFDGRAHQPLFWATGRWPGYAYAMGMDHMPRIFIISRRRRPGNQPA